MRTEIKEVRIYKYNELSNEAKENVKQWYLNLRDTDFFTENCLSILKEKYGIENLSVNYRFSYSQGDGLCLHGDIDLSTMSNEFWDICTNGLNNNIKEIAKENIYTIQFIKVNHHYSHANTVVINIDMDIYNNETEIIYDTIYKNVHTWYLNTCEMLENHGYNYFYEVTEDDLNDICESNNLEFLENGEIYNG